MHSCEMFNLNFFFFSLNSPIKNYATIYIYDSYTSTNKETNEPYTNTH